MPIAEHVLVVVRHDCLRGLPGADLPAADDDRDVHPLARHLLEPCLELRALRRSRRIRLDGLVHRGGNSPDSRERRQQGRVGDGVLRCEGRLGGGALLGSRGAFGVGRGGGLGRGGHGRCSVGRHRA